MGGLVTSASIRTLDLPRRWFERAQYGPRVDVAGRRCWFVLSRETGPLGSIPASPREDAGDVGATSGHIREVLEAGYRDWGLLRSAEVDRNLAALAQPGTLAVVTGQQPGFLTGPLYTIYKALSAIALAASVELRSARRCVPIFWMAGEDHDIDEIREARFPGTGTNEVVFRLPHRADRRPLSSLPVDTATESVLDAAKEFLGPRRHGAFVSELVDLYRGRNLASGAAAVLARLLGHHGLLILDPEKLRPLAARLVRQLILEPEDAVDRIEDGCRLLRDRGLRPFAAPRLPLFLLRGGRRDHLSPAPGGLRIDGEGTFFSREDLLELLDRSPERFSAGALMRPIIQDALLPNVVTVGGPAEVGYYAQLEPLARWCGIEPPSIAMRFQATLVEGKVERAWRRLGLRPEVLAAADGPEDLVPEPAPSAALEETRKLKRRASEVLDRLLAELPPGATHRRLEKTAAGVLSSIDGVAARASKAFRQAQGEHFDAATTFWHHALPDHSLQERRWGVFYYLAKYGSHWLDQLVEERQRAPLDVNHKLVFFEEEE